MWLMRRVLIGLAGVGLAAAGWTGAAAAVPALAGVTVRELRLEAGDVLSVALHPSTMPIELSSRRLDLEACPGSWDGEVATQGSTSWPRNDGFTECLPFADGEVVLPSARSGGGAMHLVFAVRARAANTRPGTLTIRYEPVDGFFMVGPPALAPGARSPTIVLTPGGTTVAAGTATFANGDRPRDLGDVRLTVRQRGRTVRGAPSLDDRSVWLTYHPVKPGRPVTLRASNEGTAPIRFQIGLDVSVS
jgi:hypothetical protein